MDCVFIEKLQAQAVIGVFEWERQIQQPLMLDVRLSLDLTQAGVSDDLQHAVDYKHACDVILAYIEGHQPKLIEHLAYALIQQLFAVFAAVQHIELTIRKPLAVAQTGAVGVCLSRSRDDLRLSAGV